MCFVQLWGSCGQPTPEPTPKGFEGSTVSFGQLRAYRLTLKVFFRGWRIGCEETGDRRRDVWRPARGGLGSGAAMKLPPLTARLSSWTLQHHPARYGSRRLRLMRQRAAPSPAPPTNAVTASSAPAAEKPATPPPAQTPPSTTAATAPAEPKTLPAPADVAAPPADAKKTPSGLALKVLKPGTGKDHPSRRRQGEGPLHGLDDRRQDVRQLGRARRAGELQGERRHQGLDRRSCS